MHGTARAGAELTFGKAQAYWPENADAGKYDDILGLDLKKSDKPLGPHVVPDFEAGVQVTADVSVIVQPEVRKLPEFYTLTTLVNFGYNRRMSVSRLVVASTQETSPWWTPRSQPFYTVP